jgi:hypothetical protein
VRGRAEYVHPVSRMWPLVRRYAFDALVVAVAVEGALEVALRQDASNAPETSVWLAVPGIALVVLPLLARRRFPFAAPPAVRWWPPGSPSSTVGSSCLAPAPPSPGSQPRSCLATCVVLEVGAVGHKLPEALAEDKVVLRGVEDAGRSALTEMRRPADASLARESHHR